MEENKHCNKCNTTKPITEFSWKKRNKDKRHSSCKECSKQYSKRYSAQYFDGYYYVYYLPKHNYVGKTSTFKKRMYNHKTGGKDITGVRKLFRSRNIKIVSLVEVFFHCLGFAGFNYCDQYGNTQKRKRKVR